MLFGVYSEVQGPDGNGLLLPTDAALGGHRGTAATTNNTPVLASGGWVPEDLKVVVVEAVVVARVGAAGVTPTAAWSGKIKGTFIRSGNVVTQVGAGVSTGVEASTALASASAAFVVDTSKTPNEIVPRVKGPNATSVVWSWASLAPESL